MSDEELEALIKTYGNE
jgi:hypothetical protein